MPDLIPINEETTFTDSFDSVGFYICKGSTNNNSPIFQTEQSYTLNRLKTNDQFFYEGLDGNATKYERPILIDRQFEQILTEYSDDDEDYQKIIFRNKIIAWIEGYGKFASEILYSYINSENINEDIAVEMLKIIGDIKGKWSQESRTWLLNYFLNDYRNKIKYGAILGITNTDDESFKKKLEIMLSKEKNKTMQVVLHSAIKQLNGNDEIILI